MSFSNLSYDIALVVTECFDRERDINALARTCRSLHALLNPILYRHNVKYGNGSALDWAVYRTKTTTAEYALDAGASVHKPVPYESLGTESISIQGTECGTPLSHAVCHWPIPGSSTFANLSAGQLKNHESLIRLLIERGAEHKGEAGGELLITATKIGDIRLVRLLVENDAHDEEKDNGRSTALHHAATLGSTEVLKFLLDQGFKVDAKDNADSTPLHKAAHRGKEGAARLLLRRGAHVNAQGGGGYTPLYFTVMNGCPCCCMSEKRQQAMIRLLLKYGADINIEADDGTTMLFPALSPQNHIAIVDLVGLGADVRVKDREGRTLLHEAAKFCHDESRVMPQLAQLGVDIGAKDHRGQTALHIGALHASIDSLNDLVKLGFDVNARDNSQWTALHLVAVSNKAASLKLLADAGADIDAKDLDGYTPLHNAAECDSVAALRQLLELGADAAAKNVNGLTPLDINKQSRYPNARVIRRLLIDKTARRSSRLQTKAKKNYDETADEEGEADK